MIYLDNAATTKTANEVILAMNDYHNNMYANPSSKHGFGKIVKNLISDSKKHVSNLINCKDSEVFFNSGSTEGINNILKGYIELNIEKGQHIVTTKVEHKATLETCSYLENIGIEVTYLGVDSNGLIDVENLKKSIRPDTLLVSILWVNNETGVIQDMASIAEIVSKTHAKLFVDSTQTIGKLPVDVKELRIDMLCMSGHKFHGPKGVGAIYVKGGVKISTLLHGGGQENGLRSGTSNTPGIIGFSKACEIASTETSQIEILRNHLENELTTNFDCEVIGRQVLRSPYISNVIIEGIDADVVIGKLKQTVISTGSACNSAVMEPSHVLQNMGISNEKAFGALRFSLSKYTTLEEINSALVELKAVIRNEDSQSVKELKNIR